ncbi:MAG: WhiB family transcriptional regulator [Pseudonocardiaceae bacterium]
MAVRWRDRAACRDMDSELFFPIGTTGPALDQAERAKAVCAGCPVSSQCLEFAMSTGQNGVWGGLTEDERRALRRRRNATGRSRP